MTAVHQLVPVDNDIIHNYLIEKNEIFGRMNESFDIDLSPFKIDFFFAQLDEIDQKYAHSLLCKLIGPAKGITPSKKYKDQYESYQQERKTIIEGFFWFLGVLISNNTFPYQENDPNKLKENQINYTDFHRIAHISQRVCIDNPSNFDDQKVYDELISNLCNTEEENLNLITLEACLCSVAETKLVRNRGRFAHEFLDKNLKTYSDSNNKL